MDDDRQKKWLVTLIFEEGKALKERVGKVSKCLAWQNKDCSCPKKPDWMVDRIRAKKVSNSALTPCWHGAKQNLAKS